ncbi:MAG TPA: carboxypeptidase regulatory-like domain-containing protein [Labilithrix sp.]|jgi:hypothetical protein|nr:carboxypeptidase regulatory-like domain-containing protein [Labilithrix sp.]
MRISRLAFALVVCASGLGLCAGAACDSATTAAGAPDAGHDAVPLSDNEAKLSGKVIRAQTTDEGIAGATISVADKSVTTNASGDYEIIVPRNTPYGMTVAAEGYYKLLEQELILKKASLDQGVTNLLPTTTANLLLGLFPERRADKGIVVVKVHVRSPCASEEGATITVAPAGEAKVIYFAGALPDSQQTSVKAGSTFSAALYNVDVDVPLSFTVHSPNCQQARFPIDEGDVSYTGNITAEAGEALSYMRLYLEDRTTDAATDH